MNARHEHFARLEARRRVPGNCGRCGKPSNVPTCERCREYHRTYKQRVKAEALQAPEGVVKELAQFRRELSHLRATVKNMANRWRQAYRKGYSAGLAGKRARFRRNAWVPPSMSAQELASISHAYQSE